MCSFTHRAGGPEKGPVARPAQTSLALQASDPLPSAALADPHVEGMWSSGCEGELPGAVAAPLRS